MIDLHCHVLPGIDDGPETIEDSLALVRVAVAAGIETIVATPHVNARTPNDAATIARLVGELNVRLADERLALTVRPGAEIAITQLSEIEPGELARLGLGGGRWLLVEPPFSQVAPGLQEMIVQLLRDGHRVVLAHPERCPALHRDRSVVGRLVDAGVLMSITAGSLVGRFGGDVRRYALELAREGLIHNVTSDAHDPVKRPPGLAEPLRQAGLEPLTEWLTQLVPAAILGDEEIPPRPAAARSGGARGVRRWRLRR
ncbi:MAG TPA: CpsB/CapC family capsule biosynthesis tyrosine phosphatase [Solirubrobacteraceae bacterium]|jgi:protein-tyrosine phosphatase|nr:CpsB/CapC family capsule biosynthesis tyrosine phosphatase [Solirubrobacteraceae bacterium]